MAQSRLDHVDNIPQQDSAERAFNKLARTYAAQVAALKRYRTGGEQTVRVEHVPVKAGWQSSAMSLMGGGARQKNGDILMNAVYPFQEAALLPDLDANQTPYGSRHSPGTQPVRFLDRIDRSAAMSKAIRAVLSKIGSSTILMAV